MEEQEQDFNEILGEPLDLVAEKQKMDAERDANGRFFKLDDGELSNLNFTGKVYRAINAFGTESVYFELEEQNEKGEHKLFGVGAKSGIVPQIIEQLITGKLHFPIMRTGIGTNTKYTIVKQK